MKIYKYMNAGILDKVFSYEENFSVTCSYPKDFNDPYELFLTVDFDQESDLLACYIDTIGEIPQLPTTCFSSSPCIIPMWVHYAQNHTGVVIEIDEAELAKYSPNFRTTTINYRDTPYEGLLNTLSLAARRGKFRDHALLQKNILRAAYLTKQKCWEYELEKRLIVQDSHIRKENNLMLLDLPITCVSALIVGYYSDEKTRNNVECLSERIDANYYEAKIGRTTAQPFFVDSFNRIYKFDNATISEVDYYCEECNKPIDKAKFLCSWCSVSEEDLTYAASHNSLGILLRHGLLDDYMKIFMSI